MKGDNFLYHIPAMIEFPSGHMEQYSLPFDLHKGVFIHQLVDDDLMKRSIIRKSFPNILTIQMVGIGNGMLIVWR